MARRALGIAALVLVMVLAGDAIAKGGGGGRGGGHGHGGGHGFKGHHGGGHHFGGHRGHRGGFARHSVGRAHFGRGHFGGPRFAARHQNFGQMRHAALPPGQARHAMNLLSRPGALRNGKFLSNPAARTQIAAAAALAGWHGGASGNGWWRHGNGGYGWVGPLFWPFAYNDIYDYAIWDDGLGFWGYGYPDIYAGIFPPYGYDDLAGYFPQRKWDRRRGRPVAIGQLCGNDSRAIAGMPVDQIAEAVQPTEPQLAALSELGQASLTAAQNIRIACPSQAMLTAPGRLAVMQQRIEAMISATSLIQPRLERFYGLLNDEQKARLNALGESQRKASSAPTDSGSVAQSCSPPGPAALQWPTSEIEARIHPNDMQKAALQVLQDTSARTAEALQAACQAAGQALTPPARMAAAAKRLDAMLQAVKQVRAALEDFYATLSDEQRAAFEAIGPARPA
jgi:hypothetical protein